MDEKEDKDVFYVNPKNGRVNTLTKESERKILSKMLESKKLNA